MNGDVHRAILLVPPWYGEAEQALLLGISRACGIPVTGMVDATVASALGLDGDSAVHLDIHLHRSTGVRVARSDRLRRDKARTDEEVGIITLVNDWAEAGGGNVREADPLRSASLRGHRAAALRFPSRAFWMSLRDRESRRSRDRVRVSREYAAEIVREGPGRARVASLRPDRGARAIDGIGIEPRVRLSSRLAALPGFTELVAEELSTDLVPLPPGIAAQNVLRFRNRLPHAAGNDDAIAFVASLPLEDPRSEPALSTPTALRNLVESAPTHLLWEGVAYPLDPGPFHLGIAIPEGSQGLNLSGAVAGISRSHCTLRRFEGTVRSRGPQPLWLVLEWTASGNDGVPPGRRSTAARNAGD